MGDLGCLKTHIWHTSELATTVAEEEKKQAATTIYDPVQREIAKEQDEQTPTALNMLSAA